jgi:hypothetical protein
MIDGDKKLKKIDVTPFTKVTPEMEEEFGRFANELLPELDNVISQFEALLSEEEVGKDN